MWRSLDGNKFEHVLVKSNEEGFLADGLMVHIDADTSFRLRYHIQCDSAWQVRQVKLQRLDESDQQLILNSDGIGNWVNKDGARIEALDGSRDIDIYFSPFTNTLAIRRLALQEGKSAQTQVVFISVPELSFSIARQQYTFIKDSGENGLYEYESLTSGFKTRLPVDRDALLLEYPGFFERIWSR